MKKLSEERWLLAPAANFGLTDIAGPDEDDFVLLLEGAQTGDPAIAQIYRDNERDHARARLIVSAPALLDELKRANKIIMNALNLMSLEQQRAWGDQNDRDGLLNDIGATRNHEREAVIRNAEGA